MIAPVLAGATGYLLTAAILAAVAGLALRGVARWCGRLPAVRIRLLNARLGPRRRAAITAAITAEAAAVERARIILEEAG